MSELEEEPAPALVLSLPLALPRPRLVPVQCPPMAVGVGGKSVTITLQDLATHAGCENVAGALCVSSTYTTVYTGGSRMPDYTHLYTRQPRILGMWGRDALTMTAGKPGRVLLVPVVEG